MKDYQKAFLLGGAPFGCIIGLFMGLTGTLYAGVVSGVFSGVFFGMLISGFVYIQGKQFKKTKSAMFEDESKVYDGGANHVMGSESVGGWLFLTADDLIFKSHNFNVQNHQIAIPLNQITDVKASLTLGCVPNGLKITVNGNVEKFVVYKRKEWIRQICEAVALKNRNNQRVGTLG